MVYYSLEKHKEFFYIHFFVYLFPLSLILGNLVVNIIASICAILFIALLVKNKKIYEEYKLFIKFLYAIIIFLIINSLQSENMKSSFIGSIGLIKNYFIFLVILFCLEKIESFKKIFSFIVLFLCLFVIFDILIQHFYLKDIFGYQVMDGHGRRLSGPFGDEGIAGSFLGKFLFLGVLSIIYTNLSSRYILLILLIGIPIVILTNERSISIMYSFSTLVFIILHNNSLKKKLILVSFIVIGVLTLITSNEKIQNHFINQPLEYFKDNHHKAHFLTASEIYKDNIFLGSGIKSFRHVCKNIKYENINSKYFNNRCSTHPHNIYLEIISETGLAGFIFFILLNLYILFFFAKNMFIVRNKNYREILVIFCMFVILFWPLQTTGAFFSTWNGIFYWINLSFIFYLRSKSAIKPI